MKKLFNFLAVLIIITAIFSSCEKYEIDNQNYKSTNVGNIDLSNFKQEVVNYVDNVKTQINLEDYPENIRIVERQKIDYERKTIITERFGFTTKEGYINFGRENNYPLEEELEFEKLMRKYIQANSVEEYYAKNGKLPEGYEEYEANLYAKIFPTPKPIPSYTIGMNFAKEANGKGERWIALSKTWPVMLPGWNNVISSYQPIGIVTLVSFYDKSFYRKHLFTRVQIGLIKWYNMSDYNADNKVSSWFRL